MSFSDGGEDDFSSDESAGVPAKRPHLDTYGASSASSVLHESDDEQSDNVSADNVKELAKNINYKERSPAQNIRLCSTSLSEKSSSSNDDFRPGFDDNEGESGDEEPKRSSFQDSFFTNETEGTSSYPDKGYSDTAKRIMGKMGFKPGKGLGKNEHGRTEPVEAATQKGRRGLGLQPSVVGEIPQNFKWTPDDTKPKEQEDIFWIPPSKEPLPGDVLEEWLEKGAKKMSIEDETEFVEPQILEGVLNAKSIFDSLEDEDLRNARYRSNPYETIGAVIFLNRAAVKMANIDAIFDFMFTNPKKQNGDKAVDDKEILYFADVCAGPGGFSEYILYRKRWRAKGFGFTLKGSNDFKLSDFYAGTAETFNPYYGVENDGNIFNPANLSSLKDHVLANTDDKGVHFLMADGGFSVEGQENLQEILSKQLYLCQCLAALMLVRTGGHFVVKLFDVFTPFSVGLIYIMYHCFEQVCIVKPVTSRPANSERYLVCKWKRLGADAAEKHLFSVNAALWTARDQGDDVTALVPTRILKGHTEFFNYIYKSNCVLGEQQIKNLLKIAEFSKNKHLKEDSQARIRETCLNLWQLPDKVRIQPKRLQPDDTLQSILDTIKSRPPEAHILHSFKDNVLGKQPRYLENSIDLKVFNSVYDWHFMFMSSPRSDQDTKFILGCGGKQVYQLEGTRWKLVVDLPTMPPKTLLYAEIVKEYRGQGNSQMCTKALHVIDAIMLGGEDISYQTLSDRILKCSLFCTALHKPFEVLAAPMRCKRLNNMEHFSVAINNLEYRAMKRIRKAVTATVPSRDRSEEKFYIVGSLLFLKEIKEPWESRISKKTGHKFYFGPGKDKRVRSEYFIPPEACKDMLSAFSTRVAWAWEPATAVLEGLPHDGLTRTEMEAYIQNNKNKV